MAFGLPTASGLALLLLWQGLVRKFSISPVILPAPSDVLRELVDFAGDLVYESWFTTTETLVACLLAGALGVLTAVALASSVWVRQMLYPNLVAFQLVPKIAVAPLFVVWLGIDAPSRLTFSVFISFFPVALGSMTGLMRTSPSALLLCRSLTASPWQILTQVRIPYALPYFFSGMKVAATLSVTGIVIGEFISSQHGLGSYMLMASSRIDTPRIFAALFVLCLIGLLVYGVIVLAETFLKRVWAA